MKDDHSNFCIAVIKKKKKNSYPDSSKLFSPNSLALQLSVDWKDDMESALPA